MSADPLAQLEAAVAEHAASGAADAPLWRGLVAAVREIRDGVIAGGRPVLTVAEACQLVNVGSVSALQRWCATWRVKPSGKGRYSRRALTAGLEREANAILPRRRTPARAPDSDDHPQPKAA